MPLTKGFKQTVLERAQRDSSSTEMIALCGGVACNNTLRSKLRDRFDQDRIIFTDPRYCQDNGVMVAWAGIEKLRLGHLDSLFVSYNDQWPLA